MASLIASASTKKVRCLSLEVKISSSVATVLIPCLLNVRVIFAAIGAFTGLYYNSDLTI